MLKKLNPERQRLRRGSLRLCDRISGMEQKGSHYRPSPQFVATPFTNSPPPSVHSFFCAFFCIGLNQEAIAVRDRRGCEDGDDKPSAHHLRHY
jgi:hypothetical protein